MLQVEARLLSARLRLSSHTLQLPEEEEGGQDSRLWIQSDQPSASRSFGHHSELRGGVRLKQMTILVEEVVLYADE